MFKFEWSALTPDDEKRAQDFLNQSFANIPNKPNEVGDIIVSDLTFGQVPPVVELLDISMIPEDAKEVIEHLQRNMPPAADAPRDPVADVDENAEDDDVQILMKVSYNGDAKFSIHTELVINWPQPGFGRLPISLHVNKCHFDGTRQPFSSSSIRLLSPCLFSSSFVWLLLVSTCFHFIHTSGAHRCCDDYADKRSSIFHVPKRRHRRSFARYKRRGTSSATEREREREQNEKKMEHPMN
jgi:hypothetical protein